jgi:menaquinone-dependent protoporphyrinogen oxidase
MDNRVLVAYATKYGATAGIAERIGEVLREAGFQADVLPVDQVGDLSAYGAVVLGSAVYIAQWRKEARVFLKDNVEALAERPVWLFSSGPTGEGDPLELLEGWRFPEGLQPLADQIQPRDIAVFHGVMPPPEEMKFLDREVMKRVKAPVGDFRDWEMIAAWAASIADALKAEAS